MLTFSVGRVWQDGFVTITAAADGSALGNPGPAGWAWYVNDDCWRAGGWPHGTNNQGELMAVLDLFRSTAHIPQEDLHILCDRRLDRRWIDSNSVLDQSGDITGKQFRQHGVRHSGSDTVNKRRTI